ncbi:MAG: hypothetical protein JW810_06625 [Sedimentisphaerales bacterium]|nr:hypothetical protein [Sedimentisphaerales bacterium]
MTTHGKWWIGLILGLSGVLLAGAAGAAAAGDGPVDAPRMSSVIPLDGDQWLLDVDPDNVGRHEQWYHKPTPEAKQTRIPWIIQDAFPGYHGVAWYWRTFTAPDNLHEHGRYVLRFWAVDYQAEVWLNGVPLGGHEGGESPFVLDATAAIRPQRSNLLSVRVLNPTHQPIDGIVLNETPHRNKALPYRSGSAWNQGGIMDSVELLVVPAVRIDDLFVRPDPTTGLIRVQVTVHNTRPGAAAARLECSVAPAAGGETIQAVWRECELQAGENRVETQVQVPSPRLWDLNDPFLYRVTARVRAEGVGSVDERSVRCGFRDFRFENGAFRLNGRRIYLRCSHTGNCCPIGLELPHDPDLLRRDLINAKAMRFNAIRFIAGVAKRYQLDLCDDIGLMVYEESYAGWCLADSPQMARRYDESVLGMIRRDRNHPSVVIWGLLNETPDGGVFRHAAGLLPTLRAKDDSRMVLLNSGSWHAQAGSLGGIESWHPAGRVDPCVTRNGTDHVIKGLGITWQPGQLAFHPGRNGEYSVVRWRAPREAEVEISASFKSIAERATTDVHVLHNGRALFDGLINVGDGGPKAQFSGSVVVRPGDTIDCAVGYGNGDYGADTTALDVVIKIAGGKVYNAAADFSLADDPNRPWSYGHLASAAAPEPATFTPYEVGGREEGLGCLSNPGQPIWEDVLSDIHPYQRVPHTAEIIRTLRTLGGDGKPVFLSEYGIGSAIDLLRVVRQYEQLGKDEVEDARLYRSWRDLFVADYERWRLHEVFDRPEEFFSQSIARMAGQRLLGLNAIRANPHVVGHSLTGTVDQGMTAEGLWTTFRELKPGTTDAVFDGWAPLRWCLFVEPVNAYCGTAVRLEAVLANEDVLSPGEYPVRLEVVGPQTSRVFERTVIVTIPDPGSKPVPPMVLPVFAETVPLDGPEGRYRFMATFERGAAAAGGTGEFYLADAAQMPPVKNEVVLWGEDAGLAGWLAEHGIRARRWTAAPPAGREVILASNTAESPGGAAAFAELARRIARGSTVVFLSPAVFAVEARPTALAPLVDKGALNVIPNWLYHKDEWCKRHPIFEGLPAGGLMDYTFYREIIPDAVWSGLDASAEAVAGGINASQGYASGLMVAVCRLGAGRFILNTLRIRENLGPNPVAERLLRNMLNDAARDAGEPLTALPADFETQLELLGYQER